MRLIDADVLDDKLCDAMRKYDAYDSCDLKIVGGIMEAQDLLDDAPTVDAVKVVRCKDCKKGRLYCFENDYGSTAEVFCNLIGGYMQPKDFCSYGERKENG